MVCFIGNAICCSNTEFYFWQDTGRSNTAAAGMMEAVIKSVSEINCKGKQQHLIEEYMY